MGEWAERLGMMVGCVRIHRPDANIDMTDEDFEYVYISSQGGIDTCRKWYLLWFTHFLHMPLLFAVLLFEVKLTSS